MSLDNFLGNLYEFEVDMRTYFDDRKALGMLLLLGAVSHELFQSINWPRV